MQIDKVNINTMGGSYTWKSSQIEKPTKKAVKKMKIPFKCVRVNLLREFRKERKIANQYCNQKVILHFTDEQLVKFNEITKKGILGEILLAMKMKVEIVNDFGQFHRCHLRYIMERTPTVLDLWQEWDLAYFNAHFESKHPYCIDIYNRSELMYETKKHVPLITWKLI